MKDVVGPDISQSAMTRALMTGKREEIAVEKFCEVNDDGEASETAKTGNGEAAEITKRQTPRK